MNGFKIFCSQLGFSGSLWSIGFRPFFLLGVLYGLLSLLMWILNLSGLMTTLPVSSLWHAHEMLHGHVMAIVIGFLLTATQSWTGIRAVHGKKLAFLVLVWLAGRIAMVLQPQPSPVAVLTDLAFVPLCIVALYPYFSAPKQKHNLPLVLALALLWSSNLFYHLEALNLVQGWGRSSLYFGTYLVIFMIVTIGGRVIPFFATKALKNFLHRKFKSIEYLALSSTAVFALVAPFAPFSPLVAGLAFLAGCSNLMRLGLWYDARIWQHPMLLVLYLGYFWVVIGFLMTGFSYFSLVPETAALHAFSAGSIGTMIIGMIVRVSLGHTGRSIAASPLIVVSFIFVFTAAVFRVVAPSLWLEHYLTLISVAGLLWAFGYGIYLIKFTKILITPRPDGKLTG